MEEEGPRRRPNRHYHREWTYKVTLLLSALSGMRHPVYPSPFSVSTGPLPTSCLVSPTQSPFPTPLSPHVRDVRPIGRRRRRGPGTVG